jgi:hypothetical protein
VVARGFSFLWVFLRKFCGSLMCMCEHIGAHVATHGLICGDVAAH